MGWWPEVAQHRELEEKANPHQQIIAHSRSCYQMYVLEARFGNHVSFPQVCCFGWSGFVWFVTWNKIALPFLEHLNYNKGPFAFRPLPFCRVLPSCTESQHYQLASEEVKNFIAAEFSLFCFSNLKVALTNPITLLWTGRYTLASTRSLRLVASHELSGISSVLCFW